MGDFNTEAQRRGERMGMGFLDRIYRIWGGRVPSAGVGAVPVVASVAGVPSTPKNRVLGHE